MLTAVGNLWTYPADARVITTNGFVKKNGEAVMGRGCAYEAARKWPDFPQLLGTKIKNQGNHAHLFMFDLLYPVMTMPVKHHWRQRADIELIIRSTQELVNMAYEWCFLNIVMPRPGCGNGGLSWSYVRPHIEDILDDRFTVITFAP